MPVALSTPDGEAPDFYLNLCGPLLSRYSGPLDVVVDLGAHVGAFTMLAVKEFGAKLVFAVEPDPTNFSHLIVNIELNGIGKNVIPIMAAIGPKSYQPTKLFFGGSSGQLSTKYDEDRFGYMEVQSLTLEDLFKLLPKRRIDFLKMDIEGSEWDYLSRPERLWKIAPKINYLDIELHPYDEAFHKRSAINIVNENPLSNLQDDQVGAALFVLKAFDFELHDGGERWNYYGYRTKSS